jgi:DNA repair exonuclease SbcCD ATPase subunit
MLGISIKGFRSIKEYECEINSGSITLISGPSGIGKTTIMNAIYWCLYGSLKNVRKFGSKTGHCSVEIRLGLERVEDKGQEDKGQQDKGQEDGKDHKGLLKLRRSKGPDTLVLEEDSNILKDDEAQERINQFFGTQDIWLSSCYLRQGTRNKFLESSPSDRLEFLAQLCFSSHQSPEKYLDKIEYRCKVLSKEFEKNNDFYKRDLEIFQKKRKNYPQYKQDILTEQQKENLKQLIDHSKIQSLESELSLSVRTESSIQSLEQTKSEWVPKLPNYMDYIFDLSYLHNLRLIIDHFEPSSPRRLFSVLEMEIQSIQKKIHELFILNKQLQESTDDFDDRFYFLTDEELQNRESKIKDLEWLLQDMEKRYFENETKKNQLFHWEEELDVLISELLPLKEIDWVQKFVETNTQIEKSNKANKISNQLKELILTMDKYKNVLNDETIQGRQVQMDEMKNAITNESKINECLDNLRSLSIPFEKDSIQKAIMIRKKICDVQILWDFITDLSQLEEQVNSVDQRIESLGKRKDWITENDLPNKMIELSTSKDALSCPKCNTQLLYSGKESKLVECHLLSKEKIETLTKLIELSQNRLNWMKEKQKLEESLEIIFQNFQNECSNLKITQEEIYEFPKLEQEEKQKLWMEIQMLEKYIPLCDINFVPVHDLENANLKWEGEEINKKYQTLKLELNESDILIIEQLENDRKDIGNKKERKIILENQIQKLKEKIQNTIVDESISKQKWDHYKQEYEKEKENLILCKKARDIDVLRKKIQSLESLNLSEDLEIKKKNLEEQWNEIEKKKKEWNDAKELLSICETAEKIKGLDDRIKEFRESNLRPSEDIKKEINECREKIEQSKSKLIQSEKAEELANERLILEKQRSDLILLSNRVSTISNLKQIANELEHKRMSTILNTINDFTNEMLTILFDEPIKIEFTIYKTTKSKDKIKPSIVYKILYKGFELDHVDQLSGGEADRVSLALTCALFQFTKFPYLLLDEFASSLDLNTKENAIKTLKTFLGIGMNLNKSVVCISHDTVEGIYDYHIKL